jgi:hypothetical protein
VTLTKGYGYGFDWGLGDKGWGCGCYHGNTLGYGWGHGPSSSSPIVRVSGFSHGSGEGFSYGDGNGWYPDQVVILDVTFLETSLGYLPDSKTSTVW